MNPKEFRENAHQLVDWMADYMEQVESYPVKSQVKPNEIFNQLPETPPTEGEGMDSIFEDFKNIILPGMTHWQSPNYYAYFTANTSPPSILAEMLTATLGAQCMKWETSPAAAELEERMMNWLRDSMGIPGDWEGVIHDTASTATLAAILCAREQHSNYQINEKGFEGFTNYRVYCSTQTHSSIEKGVKIAGFGKENLVKIDVDKEMAMQADLLEKAIQQDIQNGLVPLCVVVATGTTGTTAIDPLAPIASICEKHQIWLHVDAAFAGSALLLPEFQWMIEGIEKADSFVFNPHKWLFTNFDCTAYFVKDRNALLNTFAILPEYLKTKSDHQVNNYCDWGIPLGRRFRALKLWFVIRYYGLEGLQQKIRYHIELASWLEKEIEDSTDFKMITKRNLNLVCFHYVPENMENKDRLNQLNETLLHQLNATGKLYLTHTKVNGIYTLRMVVGQTNVQQSHVESSWGLIQNMARSLNE